MAVEPVITDISGSSSSSSSSGKKPKGKKTSGTALPGFYVKYTSARRGAADLC